MRRRLPVRPVPGRDPEARDPVNRPAAVGAEGVRLRRLLTHGPDSALEDFSLLVHTRMLGEP
jgi:hypothetical protein